MKKPNIVIGEDYVIFGSQGHGKSIPESSYAEINRALKKISALKYEDAPKGDIDIFFELNSECLEAVVLSLCDCHKEPLKEETPKGKKKRRHSFGEWVS